MTNQIQQLKTPIREQKQFKPSPYDHLLNEVRNEGKMYKQYLKAKG